LSFIRQHKTSVRQFTESAEGAYRKWVRARGGGEPSRANPDILEDADKNKLWGLGLTPEVALLLLERHADSNGWFRTLSVKQNEIIQLVLLGCDIKFISKHLKINKSTTASHLRRIKQRLLLLIKTL
jgi:DNA-directed RNA polymerase specialized sigma24 family protein